jgi:hypothetical protein
MCRYRWVSCLQEFRLRLDIHVSTIDTSYLTASNIESALPSNML